MDRFESMAVFVATVDKGSLSAAAEAFGISPPMAGKHIRHLEERLGARLLTRTTRQAAHQCAGIVRLGHAGARTHPLSGPKPRGAS